MTLVQAMALSKRYSRSARAMRRRALRGIAGEFLPFASRHEPQLRAGEFWALDRIDFDLARGEALAVMGANGAGKSTLLRILAGLVRPDGGEARVSGRLGAVLELGVGLDPMLSGRENARMMIRWRGEAPSALAQRVEAAADFAELGDAFDASVQGYSSGMRARLAFAIAAAAPCDLLLLDEVLAVGDIAFQRKCLNHVAGHLDGGGALILVSHDAHQLQAVCRRGLVLDQGRTAFSGDVTGAIETMFDLAEQQPGDAGAALPHRQGGSGACTVSLAQGHAEGRTGEPIAFDVEIDLPDAAEAIFVLSIWSREGAVCIAHLAAGEIHALGPGRHRRTCRVPDLPLVPGHYSVRAAIVDARHHFPLVTAGYEDAPLVFAVRGPGGRLAQARRGSGQIVEIAHQWAE